MIRILLEAWPGEVRVAAVDDADPLFAGLLDYALWRPGASDGLGDLFVGRVTARVASMAGSFISLGGGADGFLPDSEGASKLTEGARVAVRVTRSALGGKGPRLSARIADSDRVAAADIGTGLVRAGPNPVERLAALHPSAEIVTGTPAVQAALRPILRARLAQGPARFTDDIADAVEGISGAVVALPSGCVLRIAPTPALVAIDVDSGTATARAGAMATLWNHDLLPALARQIRLRDLSGAIVVDLAGMTAKRRQALAPAMSAALSTDPRRPRFLGFTALGLAEIVRTRAGPPLHERLAGPHAAALAALRGVVREGIGRLAASPDVARALDGDPGARRDAEDALGRRLDVRADPGLPSCGWRLERA